MLVVEAVWPKRPRIIRRRVRWVTNISLMGAGTLVSRLMMLLPAPLAATAAAAFASGHGVGIFNVLNWPFWAEALLTLLTLDLAVWAQHWAFHRVELLWRLHSVHHADREVDATTALRFHPLEIGVSVALKGAVVLVLGAPVAVVIAFEALLNGFATFNHANTSLPPRVERIIRLFIVTPDLHRIHHSVRCAEQDSNFGFCLSLWDRLFGLLRAEPVDGDAGLVIGLTEHQGAAPACLAWSLALPFAPLPPRTPDQVVSTTQPVTEDE